METLLYGKGFSTVATQWGLQHEEEAIAVYIDFLKRNGQYVIEVTASGLVVDPDDHCLACSPDGLVRLLGMPDPLGILEIKCLHTLAKDATVRSLIFVGLNFCVFRGLEAICESLDQRKV